MSPEVAEQRAFAVEVVERLRAAGFEALWAGGCVRDRLLGQEPKDYDVATSARPDDIQRLFGRRRTIAVGASFGVIVVVGAKRQGTVEVTTFRRDATYSDGRRPDAVTFSDAQEDAQRRDFTINGLFYDPLADRVIDYVGGVDDLRRGVVRAIGNPQARFEEDKLRLLRGVRMTARFGFTLDTVTRAAIEQLAAEVTVVSPERIAQEMRLMLVLEGRVVALDLLAETGLLAAIFPEVAAVATEPAGLESLESGWQQLRERLRLVREPSFPLALAILAGSTVEPLATIDAVVDRWRLSNKEAERARWLIKHRTDLDEAEGRPWSSVQPLLAAPGAGELIEWLGVRVRRQETTAASWQFCRARLDWPREQLDPPPLVTGHDLIETGVPPGPGFAAWIRRLRAAQLDGQLTTRDQALAQLRKWLAEE